MNFDFLAELVIENIECQLYDDVGEVADCFGPFNEDARQPLAKAIEKWVVDHGGFSCWAVKKLKPYTPGNSEYDAVAAAIATTPGG
ncbi:hypothetical protein [Pandoraea cepalis]|uniref:hypothetical protein n=1 Tax=Pandoraea cepalis TaxID=2508294 RepID=UPI00263B87BE|nr:hypothetical protein [Pandoraea cepalis]